MIAPTGFGRDGQTYNINADVAAGEIAGALKAEKLILLSDVEGVKDNDGKLIPTLDAAQARRMIARGVIQRRHDSQGRMLHRRACARASRRRTSSTGACAMRCCWRSSPHGSRHRSGAAPRRIRATPDLMRCQRADTANEGENVSYINDEQRGNCRTGASHMVDIYGCLPLAFVRGHGAYLYDADGNRYLDFFCGLAVTSLGHGHPRVVRAIQEQAEKLTHVSNVFHTEPMARLAERLSDALWRRRGSSSAIPAPRRTRPRSSSRAAGAMATAGPLRDHRDARVRFMAARWRRSAPPARRNIIRAFSRWCPASNWSPFDDIAAIERAITDQTVAIMVEPIQGEGGVVVPHPDYLARLRDLCDRANLLLILDEVQTGMGRTGKFFGYEHAGIKPDIMTLAKALGGGVPIGAMIAKPKIASAFTPGTSWHHLRRQSGRVRRGAGGDRRARSGGRDRERDAPSAAI